MCLVCLMSKWVRVKQINSAVNLKSLFNLGIFNVYY
jgi:hypothetical protein